MGHLSGEGTLVPGNDLLDRREFYCLPTDREKAELSETEYVSSGSRHCRKASRGVGVVSGGAPAIRKCPSINGNSLNRDSSHPLIWKRGQAIWHESRGPTNRWCKRLSSPRTHLGPLDLPGCSARAVLCSRLSRTEQSLCLLDRILLVSRSPSLNRLGVRRPLLSRICGFLSIHHATMERLEITE
jgi:hypothetical protein